MRGWIIASLALASLSTGGCRFCQGPDDYCGPVYWNGGPVLGFCERHNSVLSPGTYHIHDDEIADDELPLDGEMVEEIVVDGNEEPMIPSEAVPTPAPRTSTPTQATPQQWTPPRNQQSAPTIMAPPAPIRTTRIPGE